MAAKALTNGHRALCAESKFANKQESVKVAARKAFADDLAMRLRSGGGPRHRQPLRAATNGHHATFAAPDVLQVRLFVPG
jgi:hypothetical protein